MKNWIAASLLVSFSTLAQAQANGLVLDLEDQSPLSKWGRWTHGDRLDSKNSTSLLGKSRTNNSLQSGDWVFKLNKDPAADHHDLFFGLKVREDGLSTTSLGCMSNTRKANNRSSTSQLCGVQLDLYLP